MADGGGKPFWKDDEIVCDKDGVPHYTGRYPSLMKEYRRRVLFCFNNLEGDGKDATEEARDLEKKKARFAKKLLDALHGEAWRACQDLLTKADELKKPNGYKLIFECLQTIEKAPIIRKTEAFDQYFENCFRRKGQSVDDYLRRRKQDWEDLCDLSDNTSMSEDLRSYFLLKNINLGRDDRRSILLANQSDYTIAGIEKALRVSYYDVHEKEKKQSWQPKQDKPHRLDGGFRKRGWAHLAEEVDDETAEFEIQEYANYDLDENDMEQEDDEEAYQVEEAYEVEQHSDEGASQDEDVYNAYAAFDKMRKGYKESRAKLKELQKNRGFFRADLRGELTYDERKQAIDKEKQRTRCGTCGHVGHWSGDPQCPRASKSGPKKIQSGASGSNKKGKGKGKSRGKAYLVGDGPLLFSLDDDDGEETHAAYMIGPGEKEEDQMQQDAGLNDFDERRKTSASQAVSPRSSSTWEHVAPNDIPTAYAGTTTIAGPWLGSGSQQVAEITSQVDWMVPVASEKMSLLYVNSFQEVMPDTPIMEMKARELQAECEHWNLQTSGTKAQMQDRLNSFFRGDAVLKKGSSSRYVRLVTEAPRPKSVVQPASPKRMPMSASSAPNSPAPSSSVPHGSPASVRVTTAVRLHGGGLEEEPQSQGLILPKSKSPIYVDATAATTSTTSIAPGHQGYTVGGTFRQDPRSGIPIPTGMAVGKATMEVTCPICESAMVLRANRVDGGLFFGCSRFGKQECTGTRRFDEVVRPASQYGHRA